MICRSIDHNKCRCDIGSSMGDRNPYPVSSPSFLYSTPPGHDFNGKAEYCIPNRNRK